MQRSFCFDIAEYNNHITQAIEAINSSLHPMCLQITGCNDQIISEWLQSICDTKRIKYFSYKTTSDIAVISSLMEKWSDNSIIMIFCKAQSLITNDDVSEKCFASIIDHCIKSGISIILVGDELEVRTKDLYSRFSQFIQLGIVHCD